MLQDSSLLALFSYRKPPYPPLYCGSVGTCEGISTFSWTRRFAAEDKDWRRQIVIFIREGRTVTRLADDVEGPSSNFADLYKLSLESLTKVPADMIDTARLQTAALFLDAQELYCDINIRQSQSLGDFVGKNAPYFLLRETKVAGKRGLRPLLPIDGSYAIRTDPIPWEFEFTEDFIIPGSIEITHTPLEERKPKLLVALWRQQDDQSFGVIRSAEVGYQIDRDSGIVEQHDMSAFCTHEIHAVRAMAYKKAFRKWSSHTIAWACRPEVYNQILEEGDIVRLTFQRNASDGSVSTHDYLYTIEQINKSVTGEVLFVGSHFPVDAEGRSLIALTVMGAETQGEAYEVIQTGQVCDDGPIGGGGGGGGEETPRVVDTSVPDEVGQEIETGEPPGPPSLPPVEVEEGEPPILPPASDEQPPPAPQPVLPPVPRPIGTSPSDPPPPEPPPGGYAPPSPAPDPQPTEADDPVDPCEPICTSGSICGGVVADGINGCAKVSEGGSLEIATRADCADPNSGGGVIGYGKEIVNAFFGSIVKPGYPNGLYGFWVIWRDINGALRETHMPDNNQQNCVYGTPVSGTCDTFATPECPAGTTNVGTITAHHPDGDQTCVICESCVVPEGCEEQGWDGCKETSTGTMTMRVLFVAGGSLPLVIDAVSIAAFDLASPDVNGHSLVTYTYTNTSGSVINGSFLVLVANGPISGLQSTLNDGAVCAT